MLKYDIKTDAAYLEGYQEGYQEVMGEVRHNIVVNMLQKGKYSVEEIAENTGEKILYVKTLQIRLQNEQKP